MQERSFQRPVQPNQSDPAEAQKPLIDRTKARFKPYKAPSAKMLQLLLVASPALANRSKEFRRPSRNPFILCQEGFDKGAKYFGHPFGITASVCKPPEAGRPSVLEIVLRPALRSAFPASTAALSQRHPKGSHLASDVLVDLGRLKSETWGEFVPSQQSVGKAHLDSIHHTGVRRDRENLNTRADEVLYRKCASARR